MKPLILKCNPWNISETPNFKGNFPYLRERVALKCVLWIRPQVQEWFMAYALKFHNYQGCICTDHVPWFKEYHEMVISCISLTNPEPEKCIHLLCLKKMHGILSCYALCIRRLRIMQADVKQIWWSENSCLSSACAMLLAYAPCIGLRVIIPRLNSYHACFNIFTFQMYAFYPSRW